MDNIIETAIKQYKYASNVWRDAQNEALDDLRFAQGGDQWDKQALEMRTGRPCLTINRLPSYIDQVVGDIRQNTPSIKIRPAGYGADEETAQIIEGIVRGIEYKSNADSVYESAAEQSVSSSIGAYRILTQYVDDQSFDQEIIIKRIKNQFTVTPDPDCIEPDFSDMKYCFISEIISSEEFKAQYPGVEITQFRENEGGAGEDFEGWYVEDKVRIAEYFNRTQKKGKLYLLADGTVTDQEPAMKQLIAKERHVTTYQVEWRKISGDKTLEGPIILDCSTIPVVMVMGKESNVAGKVLYRSLIRWAKTPQQIYNYMRSAHMEMTALAPKVPFIVTTKQIEGHEAQWQTANSQSYPYLVVNSTPDGLPKRTDPISTNPGLVNEILQAADEIKQTTALFDASRGQANNESGRAILALQNKGDIATLVFKDNLARAIRYGGRVIVEMIPKVYDTQRILSIVKKDGSVEDVEVNKRDEISGEVLNNLTTGKYHCVVDTGPSYTTQRMEAAESQLQLLQAAPQLMGIIGDLVVKNFDWPGADAIAERIKRSIPANITEDTDDDKKEEQQRQQMQQLAMQQEMQQIMAELEIERKERENDKLYADSLLSIAKAEAAEIGTQIEQYRSILESFTAAASQIPPVAPIQPEQPQPQLEAEEITPEIIAALQQENINQQPEY